MVLVSAFRSVWSVFLTQISFLPSILPVGLPWRLSSKESACQCRKREFVPGWGRAPGEGNSSPLQYSCLENPTSRGAWWAVVHQVAESQTRLSNFTTAAALRIRLESHCLRPLDLTPGASPALPSPLLCCVTPLPGVALCLEPRRRDQCLSDVRLGELPQSVRPPASVRTFTKSARGAGGHG